MVRSTWDSLNDEAISDDGKILLIKGTLTTVLSYTININGDEVSGFVNVTVVGKTFDEIDKQFAQQFNLVIARDYVISTNIDEAYTITWESSNQDVFTNDGLYLMPENDEEITISYHITGGGETRDYTKNVTVKGRTVLSKADEISEWIKTEYIPHKIVDGNLTLPLKYTKMDKNNEVAWEADINWYSSNLGVISSLGVVTQYGFDRYVNIEGKIVIGNEYAYISFDLIVPAKEYATKEERINDFLDAIAVAQLERLTFSGYANITQTYNFLPLYQKINYMDDVLKQQIIAVSTADFETARPGTLNAGIQFITIHDTANTGATANAQAHANIQTNGYSASWHFQIDEDGAIQSIPLDEVSWHAGDGSRFFKLLDTGVNANAIPYPEITISDDGYFMLNGEKSAIIAEKNAPIVSSGIYTEIGANGNYYMNESYFNGDYGAIANKGGNRNSIGIETCVNYGSDYGSTLRHTANLVAELLIEYDLSIDRVLQHNNFSGKYCPRSMRDSSYWSAFLDLVSLQKYAKEELSDAEFVWTSNSDALTTDGKINTNVASDIDLSYSVVVTYTDITEKKIARSFTTNLK